MVTFRASRISEEIFCIVYYNDHWLKILFYNSSMADRECRQAGALSGGAGSATRELLAPPFPEVSAPLPGEATPGWL